MLTSEVLNRAADEIERRGWTRGSGWFPKPGETTPVCVEGAIRVASGFAARPGGEALGLKQAASKALAAYLHDRYPECINPQLGAVIPFSWNDHRDRTESEVIEALRAAALVEQLREGVPTRTDSHTRAAS